LLNNYSEDLHFFKNQPLAISQNIDKSNKLSMPGSPLIGLPVFSPVYNKAKIVRGSIAAKVKLISEHNKINELIVIDII
jgi:hypothetical protein